MTLTLANLTGESATQMGLLRDVRKERTDRLVEAERQLQARMQGKRALFRVVDIAPLASRAGIARAAGAHRSGGEGQYETAGYAHGGEVRAGEDNRPVAVRLKNRWHQVACIDDQWCFDLWWLAAPLTRTYYRVRRADGIPLTLFHDRRGGRWYQQVS